MSDLDTYELGNVDPDDISDVLVTVENSFSFKFGETELEDVKTFGQLCDVITNKVQGDNINDCTTQQAFYKLRNAISATQLINKGSITPDTALQILFPRYNRRQKIAETEHLLGFKTAVLRPKHWIIDILITALLASLVGLFIFWKVGLATLIFSGVSLHIATRFGIELDLQTIGQLSEKISRENYLKSRRSPATINRNEIAQKVKELFSKDLGLEETVLTRQAPFV